MLIHPTSFLKNIYRYLTPEVYYWQERPAPLLLFAATMAAMMRRGWVGAYPCGRPVLSTATTVAMYAAVG